MHPKQGFPASNATRPAFIVTKILAFLGFRRPQILASVAQAFSPSAFASNPVNAAERGPPTQPVIVLLDSGCGVHQTGGISANAKRKLISLIAGCGCRSFQNFSANSR